MAKLLDHIENLRKKPESHRRRLQFFVSAGFSLLILVLWGVSFTMHTKPKVVREAQDTNLLSPLGVIKNDLSATVVQIKDGLVKLKSSSK